MPQSTPAFGEDAFGRGAEAAARFFGTPKYIVGQTMIVIAWIAVNAVAVGLRWETALDQDEARRDEVMQQMQEREAAIKRETDELKRLLAANTDLTRQDNELTQRIETLTREIHARVLG